MKFLIPIMAELSRRRDATEMAIRALENLAADTPLRGRPPKWMTEARKGITPQTAKNGRRNTA